MFLQFCLLEITSKQWGLANDLVVLEDILNNIFVSVLLQLSKNGIEYIKILQIAFSWYKKCRSSYMDVDTGCLLLVVSCVSSISFITRDRYLKGKLPFFLLDISEDKCSHKCTQKLYLHPFKRVTFV